MTRLLIGMTGTVGVLTMPPYLLALRQHFSEIKLIMTYSATQFVPKESFGMFVNGVYTHEFPFSGENLIHMELARWAEIFAILPATANVLSKAAYGMADTLLTSTILAYEKKVIFFPNMNSSMWRSKALQRSVQTLREDGQQVIEPLERLSFEYASKEMEINHVMPSVESVLSILKLEEEISEV